MRKAVIGFLLLLLFCLGGVCLAEEVVLDGVVYTLDQGMARVTGYESGAQRVTFYDKVRGLPVVYSEQWDADNQPPAPPLSVRELVLAEGVTRVSAYQFTSWTGLERIIWPSTLTEIEDNAFFGCERLRELDLPQGITKVGSAFVSCNGLERISLPASLTELSGEAFAACAGLMAIEVAEGNAVFQDMDGVLYAKDGSTLLRFPMARPGEAYELPPGVTQVASAAFGDNSQLRTLVLPEGIGTLPENCLAYMHGLESIALPASLVDISPSTLPRWGNLERIEVAEGNPVFRDVDGVLFKGDVLFAYPYAHGFSYDFPDFVTAIPEDMFYGNRMLETITFPRSLKAIPNYAFSGCTALRRVGLPIALERIGDAAFSDCIALEAIILPPGLREIGGYAFSNCLLLKAITIPASVATMGRGVFRGQNINISIYTAEGSIAYWRAWEEGYLWAEVGGTPQVIDANIKRRANPAAVVNNVKATEVLNFREGPGLTSHILREVGNGTTVEVLAAEGDWAHVKLGDEEGYLSAKFLVMTDPLQGLIPAKWGRNRNAITGIGGPITLFTAASEEAPSFTLGTDIPLRILDCFGVWYQVEGEGVSGYARVQDIQVAGLSENGESGLDFAGYAVVASPNSRDRLHLRQEPSTDSQSLGQYFNGTQVLVLAYEWETGWAKVRVEGKEGYMKLEFLMSIYPFGESSLWGNG